MIGTSGLDGIKFNMPAFKIRHSSLFPSSQSKPPLIVPNPTSDLNKQPMRVQSAKARLIHTPSGPPRQNNSASRTRPFSATQSNSVYIYNSTKHPSQQTKVKSHLVKSRPRSANIISSKHKTNLSKKTLHRSSSHEILKDGATQNYPNTCEKSNALKSGSTQSLPYSDITNVSEDSGPIDSYSLALVPVGGNPVPVVDVGFEAPAPVYDFQCPNNSKHQSNNLRPFTTALDPELIIKNKPPMPESKKTKLNSNKSEDMKPSVYGLDKQRHVCGDLKTDDNNSAFPYKLETLQDTLKMIECSPQQAR